MTVGFPPEIRFPLGLDDDSTLYLVYNTSESALSADNPAWSDEITIIPQEEDEEEIWADNGFANLDGELLYYDAVEKDANGKVFKFKRIARNLGGTDTHFNTKGTILRGFVIAEHHNQLVDAVIEIEKFTGENFSENPETIDYRVRELGAAETCVDDFCPDVTFDFEITGEEDPCSGTTITYTIDINGQFDTFVLEFGDGASTVSTQDGTHTYAPNSKIDPIVKVDNSRCLIIQSGRIRPDILQIDIPETEAPTLIPIPTIPDIPPIIIPEINIPEPDVSIPPVVFPCIDLTPFDFPGISIGDIDIQVPSIINVIDDIPDTITVIDTIPTIITVIPPILTPISVIPPSLTPISLIHNLHSVICLVGSFPSVVSHVGPNPSIPPIVSHVGSVTVGPSEITGSITGVPSEITGSITVPSVEFGPAPTISVDYGTPPVLSCVVSIVCPSSCPSSSPAPPAFGPLGIIEDEPLGTVEVDYDFVGIPSVIEVMAPEIPEITINTKNIPSSIELTAPEDFPREIKLTGMDVIPQEIKILAPEELPKIKLDLSDLPESLPIKLEGLVDEIKVVNTNVPDEIKIDGSSIPREIKVVGIPDTIPIVFEQEGIQLLMPQRPEIEMVYKGSPIEVVVKMDDKLLSEGEGHPCFALVPCKPS